MDRHPRSPYIPRAAEEVWTGASDFKNVKLYGFVVKADGGLLNDALARYIDRPSQELGLRVQVGTSLDRVLLLFVDSERSQPRGESSRGMEGEGRHSEQLFAAMLVGYRLRPTPAPIVFAPYVYATTPPGWRAEREIFGYPQQLGSVEINGKTTFPTSLRLAATAIKEFGPDEIAQPNVEVLRLNRAPVAQERAVSAEELADAIVHAMAGTPVTGRGRRPGPVASLPRLGMTAADRWFFERRGGVVPDEPIPEPDPIDFKQALLSGSLRMLFLKQFRDAVHADRACYQAILEAPLRLNGLQRSVVTKDYELTLGDIDSVPLVRELGLGCSPVDLAFRLEFDSMTLGDEGTPATVVSNPLWSPASEVSVAEEPSRLPRYVDRGGEAVWRQPSVLQGARIYGFGIPVSTRQQQDMLDRYINRVVKGCQSTYGSQPFHLTPCAGLEMAMLLFVEYERIKSGTDDDSRLGGVAYREFLAMQLGFSNDPEYPELDWLIPFIYLDTDAPRLGGREIFGYPKQIGTIPPFVRYPGSAGELDAAEVLELRATVMHTRDVQHAIRGETVLRVKGPASPPRVLRHYLNAAELILDIVDVDAPTVGRRLFPLDIGAAALGRPAPVQNNGVDVVDALAFGSVGHVFLKQFRDGTHPEQACYQAVCKTDTVPGLFRGGARLDPSGYRITIYDHASEPLLAYIGGGAGTDRPETLTPVFAYWLDIDFELTTGRVIANPLEAPYVPDRTQPHPETHRRVRRSGERVL